MLTNKSYFIDRFWFFNPKMFQCLHILHWLPAVTYLCWVSCKGQDVYCAHNTGAQWWAKVLSKVSWNTTTIPKAYIKIQYFSWYLFKIQNTLNNLAQNESIAWNCRDEGRRDVFDTSGGRHCSTHKIFDPLNISLLIK